MICVVHGVIEKLHLAPGSMPFCTASDLAYDLL
jgi:hypothetical protein